jgi:hypothetical protein
MKFEEPTYCPDKEMQSYLNALTEIFAKAPDKHEANYQSRCVLEEMSGDPAFFTAVLRKHLTTPGVLNTKHYPVVSIDIELNPYYGLVANCWIPLPNRATDISTKAIHHHGDMLLSTVTAFGPGYEHWTFTRPAEVDPASELYSMNIIERTPHPRYHLAFVDSYIAHLPFYPPALTITYALWSSRFPTTWRDRVKRIPLLQRNSSTLRDLAARVGISRHLDLKVVEYFDFFPTADGFCGIKERKEFERGPNTDYLPSLFHVIQETGNDHLWPLVQQQLDSGGPLENPGLLKQLLLDLRQGRSIDGRLSPTHYGIERANFTKQNAEQALAAQRRTQRHASAG